MKILMTGATGFLGHPIARKLLARGHELVILSRNATRARASFPYPCGIVEWDPLAGAPPEEAFAGTESVIHLAGEPVAAQRWNAAQKKRILDSRILSTRHLWKGIAKNPGSLRTFVSASAIGYFGNRGEELLSEASGAGEGFLADVCRQWEREIFQLGFDQIRQVAVRIGVVLGREGGALAKLLPIFRKGLGGPAGSGAQWMSWIHVEDLAEIFVEALENQALRGPVNGVAPTPVTNAEFSKALGKTLHRPAIFSAPAPILKAALGEMASVVLEGQRVSPDKLLKQDFKFRFARLADALTDLVAPLGNPADDEFSAEQWVDVPVERVFAFFAEARNLETITPPWLGFEIRKVSTPELESGTLIDYTLKIHGVPLAWRTRIEDWKPNHQFVDTQLKGPYARWHHTHSFVPMNGGTLMRDRVIYRLPGGSLGRGLAHWKIKRDIEEIFSFRRKRILEIFKA